jgi:hypothetical protein
MKLEIGKLVSHLILYITIGCLFVNCDTFYLQNTTVLTSRKSPTITTSLKDHRVIDIEVTGSYSDKRPAEYTQGKHTAYISSNGYFDWECASDTNCNDSLVNNVPFSGDNVALNTNQWNANIQLSLIPFYKKTEFHVFRLRLLGEAQYGKTGNREYLNFKFGPTFSSIGKKFSIHPKILMGYSKINLKYQGLIRREIEHAILFSDSSYYTYTWEPDTGKLESYRFFAEFGATFEVPLNRTFSVIADLCGTYQNLFEYPRGEYRYLAYAEISPAIQINILPQLAILTGISIPYNPDMSKQLPIQCFGKIHSSVGPFWGRKK